MIKTVNNRSLIIYSSILILVNIVLIGLPFQIYLIISIVELFLVLLLINFSYKKVYIYSEYLELKYVFRNEYKIFKKEISKIIICQMGGREIGYSLLFDIDNKKNIIKEKLSKKECIKYKEQISAMGYKIDVIPRDLLD